MITKFGILNDSILGILFFLWTLFVARILSKLVFDIALKKGYSEHSATYFGRKVLHIFAAGVIALSIPLFFKEAVIPFLFAVILAIYTYLPHKKGKVLNWFQVKENIDEVDFCLMWGLVILIGWFFDKSLWLGTIPALFLSFGDGVTGVVRNLRYKKRIKAWEGSLAMLFVCLLIGLKMGWAGIIAATFATVSEKLDFIDDNISIPIVSFSILLFFFKFYPSLTTPFI